MTLVRAAAQISAAIIAVCVASLPGFATGQGAVIEARGEASYRIPIVAPPGTAGHMPQIALVYNSGSGKGPAGVVGFGWAIEGESRIERDTRTGTPYDLDNLSCGPGGSLPCYRSDFVLDGQDLICDSGNCSVCTTGDGACRYRTQSDDGRIIRYLGATNGWEILDRDGRKLTYGVSAGTRLMNPETSQVFSWQLERSEDVNQNWISYEYDTTSSANIAYLKKVLYAQSGVATANRSIEFILNNPTAAPRADHPVTLRPGFRQEMDRRVVRIESRGEVDALVAAYELTYTQDPDSLRGRLAAVQRLGSDGAAALPPHEFEYTRRQAGRGFRAEAESSFDQAETSCSPGGGISTVSNLVSRSVVDMNGDGVPDLYDVNLSYVPARTGVALGTGTRFRPGLGQSCDNDVRGTPWSSQTLYLSGSDGYQQPGLVDVDGDGYLDYFGTGSEGVFLGTADGFLPTPIPTSIDLPHAWSFYLGAYNLAAVYRLYGDFDGNRFLTIALSDATGDGLPDLILTRGDQGTYYYSHPVTGADLAWGSWTGWAVFQNRGLVTGESGPFIDFGDRPVRWSAPAESYLEFIDQGVFTMSILLDRNGDGLLDQMGAGYGVSYGNGAGLLPNETIESPATASVLFHTIVGTSSIASYDLNADGLLDLLDARGTSSSNAYWTVFWGTEGGFRDIGMSFAVDTGNPSRQAIESSQSPFASLKDINGDGLPDSLGLGSDSPYLNEGPVDELGNSQGPAYGLLIRATDPLGGVMEFRYRAAPQMQDENGLPANPGFAQVKPVVVRMALADGRSGTPEVVTEYHYAQGAFDYVEKEFRGFGEVTTTEIQGGVGGTQTTTLFRTDRVCAFVLLESKTRSGSPVLARERMTYAEVVGPAAVPANMQWTKCLPASHEVESVEGSEASKKVRRTTWDYGTPIDALYNVKKITEHGEWNAAAQTEVPGDERITRFQSYHPSSTGWIGIVSRPKLVTIEDSAGIVYSKRTYCYNGTCNAASKGLLAIIREHLTDYTATPPIIDQPKTIQTILYDGFGNPTQVTGIGTIDDANGLRTTISYENAYRTFPTLISTGSDVALPLRPLDTSLSYAGCAGGLAPPPALGLPCQVTEPDGRVQATGYDALGRVVRVERPGGYLETLSYTLPTVATPGETVVQTNVTASGQLLVAKTYMDGLGRVFGEESPGTLSDTVVVTRSFDDRGRVTSESLPYFEGDAPLLRGYEYDPLGRLALTTEPGGVTKLVNAYQPWKVVQQVYEGPIATSNRLEYTERSVDGLGRLVRVAQFDNALSGPASTPYVVTAKFDPRDQLYEVRDPIANDASLCTALAMGPQCATQDHVTEIAWDTFGRRVRIDDPDSGVWVYRYDDAGLLKERTQNPTSGARTQLFAYDHLQRLVSKTLTPSGNGSASATYSYGTTLGSPDYTKLIGVSSSIASYSYAHDVAGRPNLVIQTTADKTFRNDVLYDELGRVVRRVFPDDEEFVYGYDGTRLETISADPTNAYTGKVLRSAEYDAMGRLTHAEIGEASGSPIAEVEYLFDAANARLTRVTGTPGVLLANDTDGDRLVGAEDKCATAYDPSNADAGGIGASSNPDNIGNTCQCGDANGSGRVTNDDSIAVIAWIMYGTPLAKPELCDVSGNGQCNIEDYSAINAAASSGSGNLQNCPAALAANVPSSQALDLAVAFDGLGRLLSQSGSLGAESVNRSYTYDGLSRLKMALGPWEKSTGSWATVTWQYTYDALGNLRSQSSNRTPTYLADSRTWSYDHTSKPHFLSRFQQQGQPTEQLSATPGGEVSLIDRGPVFATESLAWNAQGKLHQYKNSTWSYDAFDELVLTVTGPSGATSSIVHVGDDFEYDLGAGRANKTFKLGGVTIASLATSYSATTASSLPAVYRRSLRQLEPLAAPALGLVLLFGVAGLASLTTRRRTPLWLAAPAVGVLSTTLVWLPSTAYAATLSSGPGKYGRHAEPIVAYLPDHLGTTRVVVNQDGIAIETRDYAPFGESIANVGSFAVQHRFTGQPQDDQAAGLYHYGARFYSAKWGRFASPDEVVQSFDSQGLNPFTYVLNRPTNATDPSGTQALGVNTFVSGNDLASPPNELDRSHEHALRAELAYLMRRAPNKRTIAESAIDFYSSRLQGAPDRTGRSPSTAARRTIDLLPDAISLELAERMLRGAVEMEMRIWSIRQELGMPMPTLELEVEPGEPGDLEADTPEANPLGPSSDAGPSSGFDAPGSTTSAESGGAAGRFPNPWDSDRGNGETHNRSRDIAIYYYMTGNWPNIF